MSWYGTLKIHGKEKPRLSNSKKHDCCKFSLMAQNLKICPNMQFVVTLIDTPL